LVLPVHLMSDAILQPVLRSKLSALQLLI